MEDAAAVKNVEPRVSPYNQFEEAFVGEAYAETKRSALSALIEPPNVLPNMEK